MSELNLDKAIEAGAGSNFDRGNDSRSEIAGHVVRAAAPHLLEALAVKIEADAQEWYDEEPDEWERVNAYDALLEARRISRMIHLEASRLRA